MIQSHASELRAQSPTFVSSCLLLLRSLLPGSAREERDSDDEDDDIEDEGHAGMGYSDEEIEHTVGVCIVNGVSTGGGGVGAGDSIRVSHFAVDAHLPFFVYCCVYVSSRCRRGSVRATRGTVPPLGPRSSPRPPSAHTTAGPTPGSGTLHLIDKRASAYFVRVP